MPELEPTITITSPAVIHQNAVEHGWYRKNGSTPGPDFIPSKLALVHAEVSEALEAYRNHDKENFAEELADVVIRVFDLCAHEGINISEAVQRKHEINLQRPYKHGGKIDMVAGGFGCDRQDAKTALTECWNRRAPDQDMLHALKNAWATLKYMPCMCGHGFVCGRCNTFNEIDALLRRVCGDDWFDQEAAQYAKENPEVEYGD